MTVAMKEADAVEVKKVSGRMSEVCKIAHHTYSLWITKGKEALLDYFKDELMIPPEKAAKFAEVYHPENPPDDVCPIDALEKRLPSSIIFNRLSLQFRSEDAWPKNELAWWVMRHIFGSEVFDFSFDQGAEHAPRKNRINFNSVPVDLKGNTIRLGLAAIEAVKFENIPAHVVRKADKLKDILGKEVAVPLATMLLDAEFIFPPSREVIQLANIIRKGLAGETIVLTGTFCPDYGYRETGNPLVPYEYTFGNLGSGIGLVAQQFVRVMPPLARFLEEYKIPYRVILSIADFESNSPDIVERVGESQTSFTEKCDQSLMAFQRALPEIKMEMRLFEKEWAGARWKGYVEEAYQKMKAGDFGHIRAATGKDPLSEVVRFIAKNSRSFYCEWYKKELSVEEAIDTVIQQGAEYAARGRVLAEDFAEKPVILVAGDRPKMQVFTNMYAPEIPTLCTKRVY